MKVADGINAARMMLPKVYFDRDKCDVGLECLRQYRQDWDDKRQIFRDHPRHDFTSHAADAFRYLAVGLQNREMAVKAPQTVAENDYNPFAV